MSKSEKFIEENTRNCSNEIGGWTDGKYSPFYKPWLTPDQARTAVEIAREEIIAEVCEWIDVNYVHYLDISAKGTLTANIRQLIEDLKQAMKDE